MPKGLKLGILHICTLVIHQDIHKDKYKLLSFRVERTLFKVRFRHLLLVDLLGHLRFFREGVPTGFTSLYMK